MDALFISAEEARVLTDRIGLAAEELKQAYEMKAWAALGYASWDDYCTREFGVWRLPREERRKVEALLRESGLTVRAIAAVMGVHHTTVVHDLRLGGDNPPRERWEERVSSVDGKAYPPWPTVVEQLYEAARQHPASSEHKRSVTNVRARERRLQEMAANGYTKRQIAAELDITKDAVTVIARRIGVEIQADKVMRGTRLHDSNRILGETVTTLEAVAMSIAVIEVARLDRIQMEHWLVSLTSSVRSLNRFTDKLKKEMAHGES